jgi:hypothetical protein
VSGTSAGQLYITRTVVLRVRGLHQGCLFVNSLHVTPYPLCIRDGVKGVIDTLVSGSAKGKEVSTQLVRKAIDLYAF